MADIKRKHIIQAGNLYEYNEDDFIIPDNFFICSADEVLERLQPKEILGRKFITFDTETYKYYDSAQDLPNGVVRRYVGVGKTAKPQDYPFIVSICDGTNCFTVLDSYENNFEEFKKLQPLFLDTSITKVAHNICFDWHMLQNIGMSFKAPFYDTYVLAKMNNENRPNYTLKKLVGRLKLANILYEDMVDAYKKKYKIVSYRDIPSPLIETYANADVWNCFLVLENELKKIEKNDLWGILEHETEATIPFYEMERHGFKVDMSYKDTIIDELTKLVVDTEAAIYKEAGTMFNINSGKQLNQVLLDNGLDPKAIEMSDKGNPVMDKNALTRFSETYNNKIASSILEYRKAFKLLNTYAIAIYEQRDGQDRVHCGINQTQARTGRTSITKPALQTLPKRDDRIRKIFIPDDDYELYASDLAQVEYRLFAHYAKEDGLIKAIENGHDVHQATGALIFGVPYDKVEKLQRDRGKTINFALRLAQVKLIELLEGLTDNCIDNQQLSLT